MNARTVAASRRAIAIVAIAWSLIALPAATASAMPAGAARMADASVSAAGFAPSHLTLLTGDTVTWTDLGGNHTVTSADNLWQSATLYYGDTFTRRFDAAGTYNYYCSIHRYMTGVIDVSDLLLDPVPLSVGTGRTVPLRGRAALPAGSEVAVEGDTGDGFAPVGSTTVAPDGTFVAAVAPRTTTTYRVTSGAMTSPSVLVRVIDRRVTLSVQHRTRGAVVTVNVQPASPGATVVLQLNLRERFGWWPVQQLKLDRASRARFVVRPPYRVSARVALTLPDGATLLAVSDRVRLAP
jgi:plastocyanin